MDKNFIWKCCLVEDGFFGRGEIEDDGDDEEVDGEKKKKG